MALPPSLCFRFAPSPNGYLHLGHAYSALTCFSMARQMSAPCLLRIEDIDVGRCRDEFVSAIFEDLRWLGLTWPKPVLRQSDRFGAFREASNKLLELGVLYPCFATRGEIARVLKDRPVELDPDGAPVYPGLYRGMSISEVEELKRQGRQFALRLDMEKAIGLVEKLLGGVQLTFVEQDKNGQRSVVVADLQRWGDTVIVRKDVPASYHLAVVVDDAFQGISHVVRGQDLYAATDIHRLLQVLLGFPEPVYHHHKLIEDVDGVKLSKTDFSKSLRSMREGGLSARDVVEGLG